MSRQESGEPTQDGPHEATAGPSAVAPQRVRVVLAGDRRGRPVRPRQELEEQTRVGEVLVGGLVRAQLALALRMGAIVAVGLGSLPLLFVVAPGVANATVLGLRVPWLLLGVFAYPLLVVVGWLYVRMAERNERDFAELVGRQ